jgi:hypothetical protein
MDRVIGYALARRIHLTASALVGVIALVHVALAIPIFGAWSPEAVWFVGTGLGLLLIAGVNLAHIGIEPCYQATARFVRAANWAYGLFALTTLAAVPEPQALVLAFLLIVQASVASVTLPGSRPAE